MQFTQLPSPYAPIGGPLICTVSGAAGNNLDVRITDADRITRYGAKRFNEVTDVSFDIAPYLRRELHFLPSAGKTGLYSGTGRMRSVVVEVTDTVTRQQIVSPVRFVLPTAEAPAVPALLSAMPRTRLIASGQIDELTFRTDGALTVTVTAEYGPHVVSEQHTITGEALVLFLLNTADFPNADRVTVDAGACGTVVWSIVPAVEGAVRLAWRSREGSMEHYDFPVELAAAVEADKQWAYGQQGYVCRTQTEQQRTLRSALERREVLEALAELIATPEVWIVGPEGYRRVDVVSDRAVVHRHGSLGTIDLIIRLKTKPAQPWN